MQFDLVKLKLNLAKVQMNLVKVQMNVVIVKMNFVKVQMNLVIMQLNLVKLQMNLVKVKANLVKVKFNLVRYTKHKIYAKNCLKIYYPNIQYSLTFLNNSFGNIQVRERWGNSVMHGKSAFYHFGKLRMAKSFIWPRAATNHKRNWHKN